MYKIISLLLLSSLSLNSYAILGTGLEISVAGDLVYSQGLNSESQASDKVEIRGGEFMFYAPIDHNFDGVLSIAAHEHGGEVEVELHELYLSSSKLVPRSNIKVGQYFLGIGKINNVHPHDWYFTRAPKVNEIFFDEEGVLDAGLEYNYLLPTDSVFNLTAGLTNGYSFGHDHGGKKPKMPTHYLRLSNFIELSTLSGIETGANYVGRTDFDGERMQLIGLDFLYKDKAGKMVNWLTQAEAWFRNTENEAGVNSEQAGLYIFNQYGINNNLSLGLMLDAYKDFSKTNSLTNMKINNISYGLAPNLTYSSSEFAKIRTTVSHNFTREEGITSEKDTRFELQFIFIIGSHPAHNF